MENIASPNFEIQRSSWQQHIFLSKALPGTSHEILHNLGNLGDILSRSSKHTSVTEFYTYWQKFPLLAGLPAIVLRMSAIPMVPIVIGHIAALIWHETKMK